MVIYNVPTKKIIANHTALKESYQNCIEWFYLLKNSGLNPLAVTMDGQTQVIKAINEVWPSCKVQRCIYHIKHQGEMWLRRFPKTTLAKDLKYLLYVLGKVENHTQKEIFCKKYLNWKRKYILEINALSNKHPIESDIIRAYRMIENATNNMFYYLDNTNISKTSNALEGYFSHLKKKFRNHAGIRQNNLKNYLLWYVYFLSK
jgi:transposase-like protein